MQRIVLSSVCLILSTSCTFFKDPPPEAPSNLEELCQYIFTHMMDEDTTELQAGITNLDTWLNTDDNLSLTIEGYQVDNLPDEAVANLDDVERSIQDSLVGAAVSYEHTHNSDQLTQTQFVDDWAKVSEGTYECYERIYDNDADPSCLIDGSCDQVTYQTTSVSKWAGSLLIVESQNTGQIRRIDTEYGPVLLQRTWLNEPAATSGTFGEQVNLHAQYFINITGMTSSGKLLRTTTTWIDSEYGSLDEVFDEDWAKNKIVETMQDQNQILIDWIDGEQAAEGTCLCSEFDYDEMSCPEE